MMLLRQISNVQKEGAAYTLIDVKVIAEDREQGRQATALKSINTTYTSVSELFDAIQAYTVEVVQSGLI